MTPLVPLETHTNTIRIFSFSLNFSGKFLTGLERPITNFSHHTYVNLFC